MHDQSFFCSWSGGKDSCLALHHAIQRGGNPRCLLTMMAEDGKRSRSHALPRAVLEAQARSLDLPIVVVKADKLGEEFLGRAINEETIARLERAGVDPCGEWGEYHTVVTAGPLFSSDIPLETKGHVCHEGYWFLEMESTY